MYPTGHRRWYYIAERIPGRTELSVKHRYERSLSPTLTSVCCVYNVCTIWALHWTGAFVLIVMRKCNVVRAFILHCREYA